jgi:tRNA 5-methylaminomethyl-2-thiouridine biosynthesis bifunctional protein
MGHLWSGRAVWRILDTDFTTGIQFFKSWFAWQQDPHRSRLLHYVALCEVACSKEEIALVNQVNPQLSQLVNDLTGQWWGLLPGFHRFTLDKGRVILTLCVGSNLTMLKAQQFEADELVFHRPFVLGADLIWLPKAMARCCRRDTVVRLLPERHSDRSDGHKQLTQALLRAGFSQTSPLAPSQPDTSVDQFWWFNPTWQIKKSRSTTPSMPAAIGRCVVIGAGLAGASVAAALARRGWQVQVLDQAHMPAAGASGLPVGLVVPHVSRDDCVLSRLSRAGVRMMLHQAGELLSKGQDWGPTGVLERQMDGAPQLPPHWPAAGLIWSQEAADAASSAVISLGSGLWHTHGAWVKPGELVKAWLRQPGITFQGDTKVAALQQRDGGWDMLDEAGTCITSADQVVLANAGGAFELLSELKKRYKIIIGLRSNLFKIQGMRGLLTWSRDSGAGQATENHSFPAFPVNGSGSLIPAIPVAQGTAWFMGSSYQDAIEPERSDADNHAINLAHLQQLLPNVASRLAQTFVDGQIKTWKGIRCVTFDRLPVVGPLRVDGQAGLWICAGMGSRGLSFSALCAELLAARMGAEPLPVEAKLADALDGMRGKQPSS